MTPSLSYIELQQKFCEGFSFYPIKSLEQHDGIIYKCYTTQPNAQKLLDRCTRKFDFNSRYARQFLRTLQQKDIPAAGELMYKLQITSSLVLAHAGTLKKCPVIYQQLLNGMHSYHELLVMYQQQAQQRIAAQLSATASPDQEQYPAVSPAQFKQVQAVVHKFLQSTDVLYAFLKKCIARKGTFAKLMLMPRELESMQDLTKTISIFKNLQEKTYYLLEQWKLQTFFFNQQQTMN